MTTGEHAGAAVRTARQAAAWLFALAFALGQAAAQDLLDDALKGGGDEAANLVEDIISDHGKPADLDLMRDTLFTEIADWPGVRPATPDKDDKREYAWKAVHAEGLVQYANVPKGSGFPSRRFVQPLADKPIGVVVQVPTGGEYRVWLGRIVEGGRASPVTMRLSGAAVAEHTYGEKAIPTGTKGRDAEKQFPVRFESQAVRDFPLFKPVVAWEYWDVPLPRGATRIELQTEMDDVRLDSVVATRSKAFSPSKAMEQDAGTLTRHYFRYRVLDADPAVRAVHLKSFIVYQWIHYRYDSDQRIYYGSVGNIQSEDGKALVPAGAWSKWVDATESMTSVGRYSTDNLTIAGPDDVPLKRCAVEVQFAWYPHPGAVIRTVRTEPVLEGQMRYTFPAAYLAYEAPPPPTNGAAGFWGVRDADYAGRFEGEDEILRRILKPIDDLADAGGKLPERFRLFTNCGVSPGRYDVAVPRLKKLGINWLPVPTEVCVKYGLTTDILTAMQAPQHVGDTHDPLDPTFEDALRKSFEDDAVAAEKREPGYRDRVRIMKMGDEIGPIVPAVFVNGLSDCRRAFQDYLRAELARAGETPAFFGVKDVAELDYAPDAPKDGGRFQRRLFYHSADFQWRFTSRFYERYTRAVTAVYPKVRTYCNYTPGSFMHAGIMSDSDWFTLSRDGGATLAWGEDWLGGVGWYAMAGIQTVSYYGAVVECAARKRGLPAGFYLVCGTGSVDRKLLSLAGRGIKQVYLYGWGPEYASGASDAFSHRPDVYPQIGRGARALGFADETIVTGAREPRRVALLYNRTAEAWRGAYAGMHFDRLLTFLALQHAHVPTDLILEEDLNPETLKPYRVLYIQGFNMVRGQVRAVADWVKAGGVLVACTGAGMFDEYNEPMEEAVELFGARQRLAGLSEGPGFRAIDITENKPVDTLKLTETDLTPAIALPVVGAKVVLTPTTGRAVGTYADGSCGAVVRDVGKGKVLLLGVMAGHLYRQNAPRDAQLLPTRYTAERRQVIAKPALQALGRPDVDYTEPLVEVTAFTRGNETAVLVNDFSYAPGREATLSVKPGRDVKEVVSAFRGPLAWKRAGDRIEITCPVPDPIDVVVIR